MRECLVSLTSVPLKARGCLISDWLSMVLRCSDSKPKRPGPQLICITIHSQRIILYTLMLFTSYAHVATREKSSSATCGPETRCYCASPVNKLPFSCHLDSYFKTSQLTCRHRPDVGPMMAADSKHIGPMTSCWLGCH